MMVGLLNEQRPCGLWMVRVLAPPFNQPRTVKFQTQRSQSMESREKKRKEIKESFLTARLEEDDTSMAQ
jgi:hypothetical protein